MTATNHTLTGALIAVVVKQPALAIPLALVSHFVLDALPHFGVMGEPIERNGHPLFRAVLRMDIVLVLCSFCVVPYLFRGSASWPLTLICMLAAYAPDSIWLYRFLQERKTGKYYKHSRFSELHRWIQWCERPWGVLVEAVYFVAAIVFVGVVV